MRTIIFPVVIIFAMFLSSCTRYTSIYQAANGKTKCSKRHGVY
jgi:hypothetical protein